MCTINTHPPRKHKTNMRIYNISKNWKRQCWTIFRIAITSLISFLVCCYNYGKQYCSPYWKGKVKYWNIWPCVTSPNFSLFTTKMSPSLKTITWLGAEYYLNIFLYLAEWAFSHGCWYHRKWWRPWERGSYYPWGLCLPRGSWRSVHRKSLSQRLLHQNRILRRILWCIFQR